MTIDYNKFIHPKERAALRTIKQDPLIDTVLKKFMVVLDECMMKGVHEASYIKLSNTQSPEYYKPLLEVCEVLGLDVPDMYVAMEPHPNAQGRVKKIKK